MPVTERSGICSRVFVLKSVPIPRGHTGESVPIQQNRGYLLDGLDYRSAQCSQAASRPKLKSRYSSSDHVIVVGVQPATKSSSLTLVVVPSARNASPAPHFFSFRWRSWRFPYEWLGIVSNQRRSVGARATHVFSVKKWRSAESFALHSKTDVRAPRLRGDAHMARPI